MRINKPLLLLLTASICLLAGCGAPQSAQAPDSSSQSAQAPNSSSQSAQAPDSSSQSAQAPDTVSEEVSENQDAAGTEDQVSAAEDQAEPPESQAAEEPQESTPAGLDFSQTPAPDMTDINVKREDVKTFEGHSYYFLMVPGRKPDLMEAEAICRELGGHLGTITSREEQEFLGTIYAESPWHEAVGTWWAMTGAYRENVRAPWKWVTGEEFTYTDDLPAEDPDFSGDKEALEWIGIMGYSKYENSSYYEGPFGNWKIISRTPGSEYDSQLLLVEWDE